MSSNKAPTLGQILENTLDKNDPTQRAIGLLAALVDSKMSEVQELIYKLDNRINNQQEHIDKMHPMPNCSDKIEKIESAIQPLYFADRYPKLTLLMVIGFLSLCGLGIERIIDLLK